MMDRIRNIVIPTDFSPLSIAATRRAEQFARLDGAAVHLIHVVRFPAVAAPYEASIPTSVWESLLESARHEIEERRKIVEEQLGGTVTASIAELKDPVQAIIDAAQTHDADLVIMGTHGYSGVKHAFLGSIAERALRTVDVPVLVVKEEQERAATPITKILLATDFSADSDHALEVAARLGHRLRADVEVVHAFQLPADFIPYTSSVGADLEQEILNRVEERMEDVRKRLERDSIPATFHALRGTASAVVPALAERISCQLIVMGTRGNSGLSHVLLGSVAERTVRTAPCAVLTVKAEGTDGA